MKDGSTQWMAIAPTTGYVTINNIPTAASATDILVSRFGCPCAVVSVGQFDLEALRVARC